MKRFVIAAMICLAAIVFAQPVLAACECQAELDTLHAQLNNDIINNRLTLKAQLANDIANARDFLRAQLGNEIDNAELTIRAQLADDIHNSQLTLRAQLEARIDADMQTILDALAGAGLSGLTVDIERALRDNRRLAEFYLPEANGGNLALVRQIVADAIANVAASGESTNLAASKLAGADTEIAAGRFKRAWSFLSQAYFEAIKLTGEAQ